MYLLDTDVLSLTSTTSGFSTADVEAWRKWVKDNQHGLFLSVVTVMEVRFGIEKCRAKKATKKAESLSKWLASAESLHRNRIIPVTIDVAHKAGQLLYRAVASGMMPSAEDAIIVATAEINGFTVLSKNAKDMQALNANWMNPLAVTPPSVPTP
ncbi:MAG: PIN domain-containing protein [Hyphomicrobiales bacterium]|nr:PIN domain-containing protein [Hyphomicrobiales bacterium]